MAALQHNMTLEMETSRSPKRLVEEKTFIENSAATVPDSRTEFFYSGAKKVGKSRITRSRCSNPTLC
jgi:hypothetical protein